MTFRGTSYELVAIGAISYDVPAGASKSQLLYTAAWVSGFSTPSELGRGRGPGSPGWFPDGREARRRTPAEAQGRTGGAGTDPGRRALEDSAVCGRLHAGRGPGQRPCRTMVSPRGPLRALDPGGAHSRRTEVGRGAGGRSEGVPGRGDGAVYRRLGALHVRHHPGLGP